MTLRTIMAPVRPTSLTATNAKQATSTSTAPTASDVNLARPDPKDKATVKGPAVDEQATAFTIVEKPGAATAVLADDDLELPEAP